MKKKILIFLAILSAMLTVLAFAGCGDNPPSEPAYTIMYSDGEETHTITVKYGELYSIPKPLPYKEGFRFLGLFDDETGGTQYVSSTGVCVAAFSDRRNIVLYPQFAASEFTLVLNYGVGQATNVTSVTAEYGQTVPQLPPYVTATDSGKYNFTGWYTQPDCGGKKVSDESGVSILKVETLKENADGSDTINLYAGFTVNSYNISFYDCKDYTNSWNGFDATPMSTVEVEHGTLIADVAPKTRRNGEKIIKWSLSAGFNSDETVVNGENNYYVYEYEVTVSFDTAGGAAVSPIKGSNRQAFKLPEKATREYYSFDYWKDSSGAARGGNEYFSCDTTLTACWIRTHFTVTYNVSGGVSVDSCLIESGEQVAFPSTTRQCYEFIGWEYQGKTYKQGDKLEMPSEDITLTAQWKKIAYTVTFDGGNLQTVNIGSSLKLPVAVKKAGYEFTGWVSGGKTYQPNADYTPADDTNFVSGYKPLTYTVILNGNGGGASPNEVSVTFNQQYRLPVPSRTGYSFNGWYTSASGGTQMTNSSGISTKPYTATSGTTLYAHWTIKKFKVKRVNGDCGENVIITFDGKGQLASDSSFEYEYNQVVRFTFGFVNGWEPPHDDGNVYVLSYVDNGGVIHGLSSSIPDSKNDRIREFTMPEFDVIITLKSSQSCFAPGTLITVADGSKKPIEDICLGDEILSWNFTTGKPEVMPVAYYWDYEEKECNVINLKFSDGTVLRIIGSHGLFDLSTNSFEYIGEENYLRYIGHKFVCLNGEFYDTVKLDNAFITRETTKFYSLETAVNGNAVAEGILTLTPQEYIELFMWFEVGDGLKYDEEKMQSDIDTYGLYTYEEWESYLTVEEFYMFNCPYLKIAVGKGAMTKEDILGLIVKYLR